MTPYELKVHKPQLLFMINLGCACKKIQVCSVQNRMQFSRATNIIIQEIYLCGLCNTYKMNVNTVHRNQNTSIKLLMEHPNHKKSHLTCSAFSQLSTYPVPCAKPEWSEKSWLCGTFPYCGSILPSSGEASPIFYSCYVDLCKFQLLAIILS